MIVSLAVSLGLTLILELGFAILWGVRGTRELAIVALANCLTNPPVVLLHNTALTVWGWGNVPVTAVLELAAILTEWKCYAVCSEQLKRPLLFSTLANVFSFAAGCIIDQLV